MRQPQEPIIWPRTGTAIALAFGFALVLTYSSTILGPAGMNYVPRDPYGALEAMLRLRWVDNGSDQRADWMGNLLTLVPYGFLVTAAVWPRRTGWLKPPAFVLALLLCLATVLTVKYLQLFFPPRTVTLNYVVAQSLGSLIGACGFVAWHERIATALIRRRDPVRALVIALRLYLAALIVFLLMPLDFALNGADLAAQMQRLPEALTALPSAGRPLAVQALLVIASVGAFVPVGMLLTFVRYGGYRVGRSLWSVGVRGVLLTTGLFALTTLVLSGAPAAISILYRTLGILAGAAALRWLVRQDVMRVRAIAAAAVPWLVLPYLLALALANQLVSPHWRSWDRAIAETYVLGWLPLFDYYIVTKAAAAKNVVAHALMYAPIGVAIWLRGPQRGRAPLAFVLGALLSLVVEAARYLRPGLEGDINAIAVGGFAAMLTLPVLDMAWALLAEMVRQTAALPAGGPSKGRWAASARRSWDADEVPVRARRH